MRVRSETIVAAFVQELKVTLTLIRTEVSMLHEIVLCAARELAYLCLVYFVCMVVCSQCPFLHLYGAMVLMASAPQMESCRQQLRRQTS